MKNDREIRKMLQGALQPYVERLNDPDVVKSVDARTAATIVKMLLETCEAIADESQDQSDTLSRREILDLLREISSEQPRTKTDGEGPTSAGRRRCPEAGG